MKRTVITSLACALLLAACTGDSEIVRPSPSPTETSRLQSLLKPDLPRWRALKEAPAARQEVAATVAGNEIVVAGGLTANGATDRVDSYLPERDVWREVPALPEKVHHAMAATLGGRVFVLGGFDASNRPSNRTYVFEPAEARWLPSTLLKRPRAGGAAVVVGDTLYLLGGQGPGALVEETEAYTLSGTTALSVADRASIPTPRHHVAAATDGRFIYVSGGRVPAPRGPDQNINSFERYDVQADRWERLPIVPTPRSGHASAFMLGKIVVVGGEDPAAGGGPSISITEAYDPTTRKWDRDLPPMFRPRHGVGAVLMEGRLYVLLGGSMVGLAPAADADLFYKP